ncbi:restriction endonuclease subunit S [Mammaliicoccus sciuri]|uniref:restriction endonuclease subunit S n=1 Tax=Mammaliicoccus sciuri TaxID=1296 RepID=UPI001F484EE4|nr:restriction endonuclease subunit S [Mammaliicoccus sciuri]MCE4980376.1 restriction endonuclease subunit S [Mammaliicoccus sciuri]MCE5084770.1 restriction endonuclease subunit S [Mammaliicoccus sciuri]MCE5094402.1 restriction endonuclease subunit S [Mammaliicoccus sciuri]
MTNQAKNVPELRFPEFDGEWEEKKLGDIAHITMGQSPKSSNYTNNNQDMVLVQGNADMKKGQIYPRIYTTEITKLAEIDDILLSVRAPVGELAIAQLRACIGRGVCAINANKFVYYNLELFKVRNTWKLFSQGSTFESISGNEIKKIKFQIPTSESEQEKIGEFFGKLDRQIELEEQKLAKLEEQKKGYMQKIFSQELRFKDENGNDYPEWKKKKLDDVANYRRGSFPQPYGNKEWYDEKNGEPFVQVVDVDKNMKLHDKTKQKISDLAKPKSVKGFKGDIVVTLQGSIGRVALLHYDAYIDRTLLLIDSFKIEMNKNYFKYVLYLLFLKEKERAPGGTIKTITKKVLSNFKIDIPNVGEQEKIGKFFEKYDECIQKQSNKIELLKKRKKSFLQKMFV